jgi:hypothetical protein
MSMVHGGFVRRAGVLSLAIVFVLCACVVLMAGSVWASEPNAFGIVSFSMRTTGPTRIVGPFTQVGRTTEQFYEFINEPEVFTQAGGHPWALTTRSELTTEQVENLGRTHLDTVPTRDPKDIVVTLPVGLLGDPLALPKCPLAQVLANVLCPAATQVGVYRLRWGSGAEVLGPIVNVVPEAWQSAEFAFELGQSQTPLLTAHLVRTAQGVSGCETVGGCYGFTVASNNIPEIEVFGYELTFWGVPADPSHDPMRGRLCANTHIQLPNAGIESPGPMNCSGGAGGQSAGVSQVPFLTLPTACSAGPLAAVERVDSWENPGRVGANQQYENYLQATTMMPGVTGCNLLAFDAGVEAQPDSLLADAPVGLGVNVQVPQPERPGVLGTPHLRNAVVTLPEGMSISPGIVDGIKACNESGPEGINFTGPESEEVGLNGELQLAPGHCPNASTVGEAEAETPLLDKPVKGHVYLARPGCGAPGQAACTEKDALDGNLYQLYLELGGTDELARAGIHIKVRGKTEANPATGQLTTVFEENPQTPFNELRIRLNSGPRAPIDNPAVCGPAVTTADFTPWSAPGITPQGLSMAGTPDAAPSSRPFYVTGCPSTPVLNPGFQAGTVTPQAGQFSVFTLNLSRQDREQYVKGIQVHTPQGLLGMLSNVPLCEEPLADSGHCPEASRIGTTRVASGAGSHPFEIGGSVYLTGPYEGAPFGLSIVTNAVAGPFNLGLVVVRARIAVDPETSALTVTTDETGPYAVPQIVFGVPLRLQRITVAIDRPGFMFNPTSCAAQQVSATVSGSQNALATVQSPFAVGGCKSLAFKPQFKVSTSGHTSRTNGASLDAMLSYPSRSMGSQANIASVKVSLPKQLPSRLTTLQKACLAATFNANPAMCPRASVVGIARASTPLLPVGLSGPVYFVSHGGEAFPSLIIVLQGDNVRVDLTGSTFINKAGITSSTFKTLPDVPVTTFELYLPQGKDSALAANGNLCKTLASKLVMPTEMLAQNGARFKQNTKITVTGCGAKHAKTASNRKRKRGRTSRTHHTASTHPGRAGR